VIIIFFWHRVVLSVTNSIPKINASSSMAIKLSPDFVEQCRHPNNKLEELHQKPLQIERIRWEGRNFSEVVAP
jgi:hypothetical protein